MAELDIEGGLRAAVFAAGVGVEQIGLADGVRGEVDEDGQITVYVGEGGLEQRQPSALRCTMRIPRFALFALFASGCISPTLIPCGDLSCPSDSVCLLAASRCVSQGAVDACAGLADGTLCSLQDTFGVCRDSACTLAVCGDQAIEPGEQCDGSVPANTDCTYYGYYRGVLACNSVCQLDLTGCEGRCGDGVIDTDQGEYCDHVLPAGATCFDFGYDLGRLACGIGCGANLTPCHHLGWSSAHTVREAVVDLWGGNGWVAMAYADGTAYVMHDGVFDLAPGTSYTAVTGDASGVWAASPTQVARWTLTTGWTTAAAPWSAATIVSHLWASVERGLYASTATNATLWHFIGAAWSSEVGAPGPAARFGRSASTLYVIANNTAGTWDGATFTPLSGLSFVDLAEDTNGTLWAADASSFYRDEGGGSWQTFSFSEPLDGGSFDAEALAPTSVGMVLAGHATVSPAGQPVAVSYLQRVGVEPASTDWPGPLLVSDGNDNLFAGTAVGLETTFGTWTSAEGNAGFQLSVHQQPGGAFSAINGVHARYDLDPDTDSWEVGSTPCVGLQTGASGEICDMGGTLVGPTWSVSPSSYTAYWLLSDSSGVTVGNHSTGRGAGTGWTFDTPAISFTAVAANATDDLFALGTADGDVDAKLWHYDGAMWQATSTIAGASGLVVTPHYAYALGDAGLLVYDIVAGTSSTVAGDVALSGLIGGERDSDVFALGGGELWRFDGVAWTPVFMPAFPGVITQVAALGSELFVSTGTGYHQAPFYRLQRWGRW